MGRGVQAWEKAGRARMRSPGRPPVGRIDHRRRFWRAIARGDTSLEAAAFAGISGPVGVRWFREGGGMPTVTLHAPSARFLCFAERDDIALLRAEGKGVREIAREIGRSPSTISRELRRNAATRGGKLEYRASVAQWKADTTMKTSLVLDTLEMALWSRQRQRVPLAEGMICHNDAGSQYTSFAFTSRLVEAGIDPSVGSVGDGYDWP